MIESLEPALIERPLAQQMKLIELTQANIYLSSHFNPLHKVMIYRRSWESRWFEGATPAMPHDRLSPKMECPLKQIWNFNLLRPDMVINTRAWGIDNVLRFALKSSNKFAVFPKHWAVLF
jgi:hypothetical protein